MSELVKALREQVPIKTPISVCRLLDRAADSIEALEAELAEITEGSKQEFAARMSPMRAYWLSHDHTRLMLKYEALKAENARQHREFMEAIDYAADIAGIEADTFIRVWREGGCEEQSDEHNEWGDFREWRAARRAREGGNADG